MGTRIIVASKNPVKTKAVENGFSQMFDEDIIVEGVSVSSDVSDQPLSDEETLKGAENRSANARSAYPQADYWVGVEGGIQRCASEMQAFAWVVINSTNRQGKARTGTFYLPQTVVDLIDAGKELGEADDIVFGRRNSKQQAGAVGILTGNIIDRTSLYTQAVILALIPFVNEEIF